MLRLDFERLASRLLDLGRDRLLIGVDGAGASGRTTLAERLASSLDGAFVVHGDDFYRPSVERPTGRFAVAGQFDLERLRAQVLAGGHGRIRYQRYDWASDRLDEWIEVPDGRHVIVEGIYTTEARLRDAYHFRIFCTADRYVRLSRGLARDGEVSRARWVDEWMPAEDRYFEEQHPQSHAHLVVDGGGGLFRILRTSTDR
jgi:uridine kinase